MNELKNGTFTGERALYGLRDTKVTDSVFKDGESPLKESRNVTVENCSFEWKYPLWYSLNPVVRNCKFEEMSRSGIWYTHDIRMENCDVIAPKEFRKCDGVVITDCVFHNAQETLWWSKNIRLNHVKTYNGDYLCQGSSNVEVEDLYLEGNYAFDGGESIVVRNSILHSKDSFWNVKNATIENCTIIGEYLGWNSENLTFINCRIESLQGLCYIKGLKMINCSFFNTSNLMFELCSDIDADIVSRVDSIKNPISGKIQVKGYDELILDKSIIDPSRTEIIVK